MKKGLLLAILALFTSVALVGCGQKSEEQKTDNPTDTVATDDQKSDGNSDGNKDENKDQNPDSGDNKDEGSNDVSLGDKKVEGESVEGTIYGTGKYRLTKGSDCVLVEWAKDNAKNEIEYVFSNDKLSAIKIKATYENEEQAKATFDSINKSDSAKNGIKNPKQEGNSISYEVDESQWNEIKDYTKDQIFDEQKKTLEELSKVDDIKSDD